jgi:hypothetical protein
LESVGLSHIWIFGLLYGNVVYFMVIWYILWSFGIFWVCFAYFSRFSMLYKNLAALPLKPVFC